MAQTLAFGSGTLKYGNGTDLGVSEIQLEVSEEEIALYGSKTFPIAVARGKGTVKGSFKVPAWDSTMLTDITNATMGPNTSETALVWDMTDTAGVVHRFTLGNITLTSKKMSSGNDKWLTMDVSFSAAAKASDGKVLAVTTVP